MFVYDTLCMNSHLENDIETLLDLSCILARCDTWQQAHQDDARVLRHMGMDSAQEVPKMFNLGPFATTHAVQVARQCKGHTAFVHAPRLHSTVQALL